MSTVEKVGTSTGDDVSDREKLKGRLTRFYERYNKEKLDEVDEMVEKYLHNDDKLFTALTRKYGAEPVDTDLFNLTEEAKSAVFQPRESTWSTRLKTKVFSMLTLPGGRTVIGGSSNGALHVVNPINGNIEKNITEHTDCILSIVMGVQGLFTASADHSIKLWSLKTFELVRSYEEHDGMVMAVAVSQAIGSVGLFSASDDLTVKQWNIDNGSTVNTYKDFETPINALCTTSTHCFCGSTDGVITVIEMIKKKVVRKIDAHVGGVWAFATDPEGVLFSAGGDALIKVWPDPVEDANCSSVLTGHVGTIRTLMFYEDVLFSSGADSTVCVWDFIPDENICVVKQVIKMMSPNGAQCEKNIMALGLANNELIAAGFDKVLARWDVSDLLPVTMDMIPLPSLDNLADDEFEQKLEKMHPRERHQHFATLDVTVAVKRYTELPINYLIDSLNFKVESSWLVNELLMYIPFLVMFLFFFLADYSAKDLYYMNLATVRMTDSQVLYQFKTERTFNDGVTNAHWWNQWASLVLIPGIWGGKDATSKFDPIRFMGQNQFIGALRFRTKRVANKTCTTNADVLPDDIWSPNVTEQGDYIGCFDAYSFTQEEDETPFACQFNYGCAHNDTQLRDPSTFNFSSGLFEFSPDKGTRYNGLQLYRSGGFVVDIPGMKSQAEALGMLSQMMSNGFIDKLATRFLSVEFFQYNPDIGFFVANRLVVEQKAGGSWFTTVQHKPFRIFNYSSSVGRVVYDCFFFVFVLYWLIHYFLELRAHNKMYGSRLAYIFNTWNIIELVNIGLFITMFALRWEWMYESQFSQITMPFENDAFPDRLDSIVDHYQYQVYINAFNTVLTMLKILKYVRLNDQLNILTRTLAAAQDSIMGVLLLFVYFVFAFAITGVSLYGENLYGYRTIDASYNTLMRMLVGDMDYVAMSEIHRPATVVFFWAFLIFANFLLLNFLIAVLSDAFQDVCDNRLPLPIDKAIVRAAEKVREQLLPAALRITVLLLSKRRTRTELTAKQARFMRKYRESILSEEAVHFKDFDEVEHTYVQRSFFLENVPDELRTEENLNFMHEVWHDMAWEWHWHMLDKHNRQQHEQEELVQEVVDAELGYFNQKGDEIVAAATIVNTISHKLRIISDGMARHEGMSFAQKVEKVAVHAVDAVTAAADSAQETVTEAASKIQESVEKTAGDAQEAAEQAAAAASSAAQSAIGAIGSVFGSDKSQEETSGSPANENKED